ncbi:MAG: SDR family oxidoreductase [Dehalococcoidia bacterium]|nr:SDR family oxidoreductase [Dehalococcoidia bacterium]
MGERLKGKVAVVTGAGRGIGRGIALLMAAEGAKVVVNDAGVAPDGTGADSSVANAVVEEIRKKGGTAVANHDNVASLKNAEHIIKMAVDSFGRIDILVNNAGILRDRMIFNMTEEEWDAVIAVHLKGNFACTKFASILMRQQKYGRIVCMSSTSGLYGNPGQANYGAAKDGIAGLVRTAARDLGRYGVTINAVAPSADTRLTATISDKSREMQQKAGIVSAVATERNYPRPPEAIAPLVTWLCTDAASHVNGNLFYAAGGVYSLLNNPAPARTIQKQGRWTFDEIKELFPSTLGMDMTNPAPPAAPR